jgi:hypothetical protein
MDQILLGHTLNSHHFTKFSLWGYLSLGVCTTWTTEGNHEQRYLKLLLFVFVGGGGKSRDLRFTTFEKKCIYNCLIPYDVVLSGWLVGGYLSNRCLHYQDW